MNTFLCIGVPSQIFILPIIALGQQVDTVHGFTRACIVTPFLSKVRVVAFIKGTSPPTHPYIKQFRAHVTNMEMCSLTLIIIMKWHFLKCPAFLGGGGIIILPLKVPPVNTSIIFFFNKVLNVHDPMIGMMGALSWVTSFMVWALATQGWMMYLATGLSSIGWYMC